METLSMGFYTLPVLIGFAAGVSGYIIVRFWIRPIWGYRRLKRQIRADLTALEAPAPSPEAALAGRRHAAALGDLLDDAIPAWYRMLLKSRGEDPERAANLLMALAGTRRPKPGDPRVAEIRTLLRLAA